VVDLQEMVQATAEGGSVCSQHVMVLQYKMHNVPTPPGCPAPQRMHWPWLAAAPCRWAGSAPARCGPSLGRAAAAGSHTSPQSPPAHADTEGGLTDDRQVVHAATNMQQLRLCWQWLSTTRG
jgi:hypothetical protein